MLPVTEGRDWAPERGGVGRAREGAGKGTGTAGEGGRLLRLHVSRLLIRLFTSRRKESG